MQWKGDFGRSRLESSPPGKNSLVTRPERSHFPRLPRGQKAEIAQLVEQLAFNQLVLGSSPSPRTLLNLSRLLIELNRLQFIQSFIYPTFFLEKLLMAY